MTCHVPGFDLSKPQRLWVSVLALWAGYSGPRHRGGGGIMGLSEPGSVASSPAHAVAVRVRTLALLVLGLQGQAEQGLARISSLALVLTVLFPASSCPRSLR